jgi:hypothetical protein
LLQEQLQLQLLQTQLQQELLPIQQELLQDSSPEQRKQQKEANRWSCRLVGRLRGVPKVTSTTTTMWTPGK